MSIPERFLWRDGDIIFLKADRHPTREETEKADKAFGELLAEFRKRLSEQTIDDIAEIE